MLNNCASITAAFLPFAERKVTVCFHAGPYSKCYNQSTAAHATVLRHGPAHLHDRYHAHPHESLKMKIRSPPLVGALSCTLIPDSDGWRAFFAVKTQQVTRPIRPEGQDRPRITQDGYRGTAQGHRRVGSPSRRILISVTPTTIEGVLRKMRQNDGQLRWALFDQRACNTGPK